MKKRFFSLLLTFALLLCGCANKPSEETSAAMVFTDDLGREVTVDHPQRVAALLGSFAQIWMLAGGTVCAAPNDAWNDLELEMEDAAIDLGSIHSLSLELLLSAQPDLVLASTNTSQHVQWKETLEAAGITVAYFDVNDFEDYLRVLDICTDITEQKENYALYGTAVQQQINTVIEKVSLEQQDKAPTVLCLAVSGAGIHAKNSEGSVLSRILQKLGCVNLADTNTVLLDQLSMEVILAEDPDYIFIIQRGDDAEEIRRIAQSALMEHPMWAALTAVQQDQVYFMEKALFNLKPNHRWGEAYQIVGEILCHD